MASVGDRSRYLTGASLLAAMLAAGCAVMEPRQEAFVPAPIGATWTNDYQNTGSFGQSTQLQITRGESTWQGKSVVSYRGSTGVTVMAAPENGGFLAIVAPDGKPVISFEPATGWEFPVYVGKSWTTRHRLTLHAANRVLPFEQTCKVEGYGDVSVPAGTFKAFEVACSDTLGSDNRFWYSNELGIFVKQNLARGANSPFGAGTQQVQILSQNIKK